MRKMQLSIIKMAVTLKSTRSDYSLPSSYWGG